MSSRAQCEAALALYRSALLAFPNVVDVGIAPLDRTEVDEAAADLAVAVYVRLKVPLDALEPDDVLPSFLQVRDNVSTYKVPTRVFERHAPA